MKILEQYSALVYLCAGAVCSFIMAILRTGGFTMKNMRLRLTEAIECSFISSAITIIALDYFHASEHIAIPISIFCGFLGTDILNSFIMGLKIIRSISNISPDDTKSKK